VASLRVTVPHGCWLRRTNLWRDRTNPRTGSGRISGRCCEKKQRTDTLLSPPQIALPTKAVSSIAPQPEDRAAFRAMTSDDNLSLILRRPDEIERKLDRMMEELRTPAVNRPGFVGGHLV
jgi:hypothetical protein